MRRLWGTWLLGMLLACGGDGGGSGKDDDDDNTPGKTRPGMGPSTAQPVGTPYTLPEGISLQEPIEGYDKDNCYPEEQEEREPQGSGGLVRLCLQFTNTHPSQQPITVRFPAGLVFISYSDTTQNGVLLQVETIEIPPGGPYAVDLSLYCLNSNRDGSYPGDDFKLGPVTQDSDVLELTQLVQDKTLTQDNMPTVQEALWSITDGDGLTPQDRQALGGL